MRSWVLTVIRIAMGNFFLYELQNQVRGGWIGGDGLSRMLSSAIRDHSVLPPFRWFLEEVVITNDGPLTLMVVAGELVIGVALAAGIATRLTAAVALFMNVNFLLLNGATVGGAIDAAFIVGEVAVILVAPELRLSVDRLLAERRVRRVWMSGQPSPY
jgi:uncharacterized membrane protein YphA (DoxX/SURF4 family)